jgi:hypothetical protein
MRIRIRDLFDLGSGMEKFESGISIPEIRLQDINKIIYIRLCCVV